MQSKYTIRLVILILGLLFTTASTEATENNFSCTEVSEIPQFECEVLVDLYSSTDGPNWRRQDGWLTATTSEESDDSAIPNSDTKMHSNGILAIHGSYH